MHARIFMDESGIHDGSPIIVSAAAWSSPERWNHWAFDWCLAKGSIDIVHAVDCHNRTGPFTGWTIERRNAFVGQLLPVIGNHKINARIAGYHRAAYMDALKHHPRVLARLEDPYHIAFMFALNRTWPALIAQGYRVLEFIHETSNYQAALIDLFDIHCRRNPGVSATLSFGTKRDYLPLQCADGLAYEGNHQLRKGLQGGVRRSLSALDPTGGHMAFVAQNEDETREMARFLIERYGGA